MSAVELAQTLHSVSSKSCSPPKVFGIFLTHFWRISDAFWNVPLFPIEQDPFWRIFDAFLTHFWRILVIADAFSENTFWTMPIHPPCRTPGCSYTPIAALSAVSSVSQGCRSYMPPQTALSHPIPDPPCSHLRGVSQVVWTSKTQSHSTGGAATLASVALHFDAKPAVMSFLVWDSCQMNMESVMAMRVELWFV